MTQTLLLGRRRLLAGLTAMAALGPAAALAKAAPVADMLHAGDLGLTPDSDDDQSAALQKAADTAGGRGLPLFLPGGIYRAGNVKLSYSVSIFGVDGATIILGVGEAPIFHAEGESAITLRSLSLDGTSGSPRDGRAGLLAFSHCEGLRLEALNVHQGAGNGLFVDGCSGLVTAGNYFGHGAAGIFAINSHELGIAQNRVFDCANGGILVWRDESGADGTIVSGNHVMRIAARGGGSGQNGNGVNIFRADNVIVTDNVIMDCDFSAVRANTTNDTVIRGNSCSNCREVAIYSEFAFSGSVISGNIVDGAAAGISITNFDKGGRLAVCSGNIVRNIAANSPTNRDVTPYGIYAEADTVITGNTVSAVPGIGIGAGYGAFLRNVLVADNIITDADTGIAVSVAEGTGAVRISGNMISGAKASAIAAMRWRDVASPDLVADAGKFPNVSIEGNVVSP